MKQFFSPHSGVSQICFAFVLAIIVFLSVFGFSQIQFVSNITQSVNDRFTHRLLYPSNLHRDEIVILKIDDRSLDAIKKSDLGMLAFDKGVYAQVLERIFEQYEASVVGIDIVFSNPSVLGETDELLLADALKKFKDRVILATRSNGDPHPLCLYSEFPQGVIDMQDAEKMRKFQLYYSGLPEKYCENQSLSARQASFGKMVLDLHAAQKSELAGEIQGNISMFESRDDTAHFIEYFYNPQKNDTSEVFGYQSYSFIDVLEGKQDIDLQGKIVLIGEVGTLIHDRHFTPVLGDVRMSGVEIQANIISTLREGKVLKNISFALLLGISILFQILVIFGVFRLRIWHVVGIILFLILGTITLGGVLFASKILFDIFVISFSILMSAIITYIYRFQVTDRAKRQLKKQFGLYVSPEIVEKMSQDTHSLSLAGEKREMTLMFSDIVGFTGISEHVSPEKLVVLLNEYFSEMTQIILDHEGTLDKYIGDAIMSFFNAPLELPNHSYHACISALKQQSRLRKLNTRWSQEGYPEVKMRLGIHTGEAIHGNIGSSDTRLSYTAMGDSVNLASRLEGICKYYGVFICVSEDTYVREKENFHFRELDMIQVKGRQKAVRIYELIGPKSSEIPEKFQYVLQNYAKALELYRSEDYRAAGKIFLENSGDPASKNMALRCKQILEGKATVSQGIFEMTSK